MKYPNFYQTVTEASMRLRGTIIMYNGPGEEGPYYVCAVTDHLSDGKFRIYMKALGNKYISNPAVMPPSEQIGVDNPALGGHMDQFMKLNPSFGMVRKELTSPHFNGFRPFPLGMMNKVDRDKTGKATDCETLYLERQPNRGTSQGLVRAMIYTTQVTPSVKKAPTPATFNFDIFSPEFKDCILGRYPSPEECLRNLRDPKCANEGVAFHRYFAFVRGPFDMIFLSYKGDIVGILPNNDLRSVDIGKEFRYTKETVDDLRVFSTIRER